MAKTMTYDEAFVRLTIAGDEAGIKRLVKQSEREQSKECPDCGGTDIMDNGETQVRYLTFACKACGQQWDAAQDVVR